MKQLKRDTNIEEGTGLARSNVMLRCGDCLHYKGTYHPAMGKKCFDLGIKTTAVAPTCYTPNVGLFRKVGANFFKQLATTMATLTPQQSRVLMGLLKAQSSLERTGFTFLQKVYFKVGEEYLENYHSGYVLSKGHENTIMVVGEQYLGNNTSSPIAFLLKESILTWDKFKKKKESCIQKGLVLQPKRIRVYENDKYEPPTLDTPPEGEKPRKASKKFKIVDETRS